MEKTPLHEIYEKWHGLKSANEFMVWLTENEDRLKAAERDDAKAFFKAGQKYGQQLQIEARGGGKFLNKKHFDKYYETRYGK